MMLMRGLLVALTSSTKSSIGTRTAVSSTAAFSSSLTSRQQQRVLIGSSSYPSSSACLTRLFRHKTHRHTALNDRSIHRSYSTTIMSGTNKNTNERADNTILDLSALATQRTVSDAQRQEMIQVSKRLRAVLAQSRRTLLSYCTSSTALRQQQQDGEDDDQQQQLLLAALATASRQQHARIESLLSELQAVLVVSQQQQQQQQEQTSSSPQQQSKFEVHLSATMEQYFRLVAFAHYIETGCGRLLPPPPRAGAGAAADAAAATAADDDSSYCFPTIPSSIISQTSTLMTDEEYIGGACIGLILELEKYCLTHLAPNNNLQQIHDIKCHVAELFDYLLQYNFRNGYLRKQFDKTKYAVRTIETFLYELSITSSSAAVQATPTSASSILEPVQHELDAMRQRVERRDELRENVIKICRDGQKAAKQAIYALHRTSRRGKNNDDNNNEQEQEGDEDPHQRHAYELLDRCRDDIIERQLLPLIVQDYTMLRYSGSFTSLLEEYIEAELFATWLYGRRRNSCHSNDATEEEDDKKEGYGDPKQSSSGPSSILLLPEDFVFQYQPISKDGDDGDIVRIEIQPEEYIGGLCDFTGEMGRYAVVHGGTRRDVDVVKTCLRTCDNILAQFECHVGLMMGGGHMGKKVDMVRRSVDKLYRMIYEMKLSATTGGGIIQRGKTNSNDDGNTPNNDDDADR